ncbi:gas vesicle protein GvpG [Micromonospora sp. CPCC 206061]|uniref:gas vesicle protein GvpG n=1 Tax=Micromonospora sp. CPCC 206061 TaxID=3122410 RepID=UPI002FEE825F
MGPLSLILGLPLAPVRGLITLAELLRRQAERERTDPVTVRRELERLDDAVASGEMSDHDRQRAQQQILGQAQPRQEAR